jgi:hypothetical protein
MAAEDSLALRARLEDLPQELYDSIFNLTFSSCEKNAYSVRVAPKWLARKSFPRHCT